MIQCTFPLFIRIPENTYDYVTPEIVYGNESSEVTVLVQKKMYLYSELRLHTLFICQFMIYKRSLSIMQLNNIIKKYFILKIE